MKFIKRLLISPIILTCNVIDVFVYIFTGDQLNWNFEWLSAVGGWVEK